MVKLRDLLDRDELDWDDPRHRELYYRELINKDGRAYCDEDDQEAEAPPHSSLPADDNEDTSSESPQA